MGVSLCIFFGLFYFYATGSRIKSRQKIINLLVICFITVKLASQRLVQLAYDNMEQKM